ADDVNAGVEGHHVEEALRLVRFDRIGAARGRSSFALKRLVPCEGDTGRRSKSREILPGNAADTARVADVNGAEPARSHSAEMPPGLEENDGFTHARSLHRGDDPSARAAVD